MKAEKDTGNGKLWFDQSAGDIHFFNQRPEQIYGGVIMAKNIEPKLKKIGDYLKLEEDTVFTIPEYQRAYSWGVDNCDKLWKDINDFVESESKDRYFFGTIIINCQDNDTKYGLIDGQQRTTTFLLLLKALLVRINVAIKSENSSFIKQVIYMLYLILKNSIAADGEYGKGNQLFKEIRSVGLLKKLKDAYSDAVSKELSLEKMKVDNSNKVLLKEASRNQLLTKSKTTTAGKKRFKQRVKSRVATTVKQYNSIDMNKLFKDNIFSVDIDVQGETNKYTVKISFGGFLDILHDQLKQFNSNKVDLRMITRSLITGFNRGDVYIHCTCPDFKYVYSYVATKDDTNSGEPENIPARIRNPQDNKGSGCKHTLLVLSNSAWLIKCASVINNYIKYMEKHEKKLYQTIIYPAIYQKEYEEPTKEVNNVVNTEETTETN